MTGLWSSVKVKPLPNGQDPLSSSHPPHYCSNRCHRPLDAFTPPMEQTPSHHSSESSHMSTTSVSESLSRSATTLNKDTTTTDAIDIPPPAMARYGFRNYQEIYLYLCLIVGMISTTTFGVIVAVYQHRDPYLSLLPGMSSPTTSSAPVVATTMITDQEELDLLLNALSSNDVFSDQSGLIPSTVQELQATMSYMNHDANNNKNNNTSNENTTVMTMNDPYLRAAVYLIQNDTTNIKEYVLQRYALATFYYTTNGSTWYNQTNWLSQAHYCTWYGIVCCDSTTVGSALCTQPSDYGRILELDLYRNRLNGTISSVLALLPYLQSIYLSDNQLVGTIPGTALASLPHLLKFYAAYNDLSGTIPNELANNGIFSTSSPLLLPVV